MTKNNISQTTYNLYPNIVQKASNHYKKIKYISRIAVVL